MNRPALLLEAAPNFRDFGGYPTLDGRRVRERHLFRSELLLDLGERDLQTLADLDIRLVCDLRSPGERQRVSNQWPQNRPYTLVALDTGGDLAAVQPDKWGQKLSDPAFDEAAAHAALIDNYRRMPGSYYKDISALFDYLSQFDARPVLVHCAAGKDRTGFVCAALLWALGVPRDLIFEDYLRTRGRFSLDRMQRIRAMLSHREMSPVPSDAPLRVLASVHPDYLEAAFDTVEKNHGGFDGYLERQCGLTPARREQLQETLLTV